jgi:hypothetical protein
MAVGRRPLCDGEEPRFGGMTRRRRGVSTTCGGSRRRRPGARAEELTAALMLLMSLNHDPLLAILIYPCGVFLTDAAVEYTRQSLSLLLSANLHFLYTLRFHRL